MKTKIAFLLVAIFSILSISVFTACSDDEHADTTPPTINLLEPEEGAVLKIGSNVHFEMEVADNEMLASYKIEIHNSFDGHQHAKTTKAGIKSTGETTPFFFQKTWSLAGKKNATIHHHEIVIPENATPGKYHLMIHCTDAAGNESHIAPNIELSHDGEVHEH